MTAASEPRAARVLLVEDEAPILDGLVALFDASGFEVDSAADGLRALARLAEGGYDLVVLDLMLPGLEGLEVLRRARARGDGTPVLVLTAKGAEDDVVAGLEAGADDYVTKPFGIRELLARARGLLRRPREASEAPRRVVAGACTLDFDEQVVTFEGGQVRLTSRESTLLHYLASRAPRPATREELLVDVWGYRDGRVRTRTVDVHVQQLRAKLRDAPGAGELIETVRGRGYRWTGVDP